MNWHFSVFIRGAANGCLALETATGGAEVTGTCKAVTFGSPCAQLPARWFLYIEGKNVWTSEPSLRFAGPAHPISRY